MWPARAWRVRRLLSACLRLSPACVAAGSVAWVDVLLMELGERGAAPLWACPAAPSRVRLVAVVVGGGWSLQVELLPW